MGAPSQPLILGVTVMVAITGLVPVLMAAKEPIFPLPEELSPINCGLLFCQRKVVPGMLPENKTGGVSLPLQTVNELIALASGSVKMLTSVNAVSRQLF